LAKLKISNHRPVKYLLPLFFLLSLFVNISPVYVYAQTPVPPSEFFCVGNNPQPPCATIAPTQMIANPSPTVSQTTSQTPSQNPSPSTNPCGTNQSSIKEQSAGSSSVQEKSRSSGGGGFIQQFFQFLSQLFQALFNQLGNQQPVNTTPNPTPNPTMNPTSNPTTVPVVSPTTNPCPSQSPTSVVSPTVVVSPTSEPTPSASISAAPSTTVSTQPSATTTASPSNSPSPTTSPCPTSQSSVSGKSTSSVQAFHSHGKRHFSGRHGGLQNFFQFLIQLLQQLLQQIGVQNPNPCSSNSPTPSQTQNQPSQTQNQPSQTQNQPSQTQNQPSQTQNQPSQTQNQPSQAQNQPSQTQNQPSQTQNQPSQTQNQPSQTQPSQTSQWGYAKPNNLTLNSTSTQTNCTTTSAPYCTSFKVIATWTAPTTTTTGLPVPDTNPAISNPSSYTLKIYYNGATPSCDPTTGKAGCFGTVKTVTVTTVTDTLTLTGITAPYYGITVTVTANGAPGTSQANSISIAPGKSNASWQYSAPTGLKETTDPVANSTKTTPAWTMTVTWKPVTTTTTGTKETPTNYGLAMFKKDGTVIGGISNISTNGKVSDTGDPAAKFCTASVCTQTFSAPTSDVTDLAASGSYVKVSAVGVPASSPATQAPLNPWTFQAPPNLKEQSSESTKGTTNTFQMKVTWDVPKAIEGGGTKTITVTPASYGIQIFDGSNKAIGGISTQGAASCTTSSCTQIFSITSSSANSASIVALASTKAYVEVAPKGAPISPASSNAKYTIKDIVDSTCTDFSSEGYQCIEPTQAVGDQKNGDTVKHIGAPDDATCPKYPTNLCYQVTKPTTGSSVAGSSSVFSQAVDQTATAMGHAWNAITNPIVQFFTSL